SGAAALAARFAERGPVAYFAGLLDVREEQRDSSIAGIENAKLETGKGPGTASRALNFEFRASAPGAADRRTIAALIAALTVPGLIGRPRAVELLANAVLPCLAALGPEVRARRAEALYRGLPLSARYGAVRHLHEAVGGRISENRKPKTGRDPDRFRFSDFRPRQDTGNGIAVRVGFRRQQGMLYLLKQYCTQGGCGRCPLS
ncbi:MAG: hypothetical protein ACREME_05465, partial [Gemmatimonadales bacterium]